MKRPKSASQVALAEVLRLVLPLSTQVVGQPDTGRLVTWVAVLTELDHYERQAQAGDIIILPAALQREADARTLTAAIPPLTDLSVAALLVFAPLPQAVNEAALTRKLPILVVDSDVSLREVHQGIAGLLVDRQKQITARGMQLYRRLTEMSREGKGLAAMTETMARLTGKIVAVQDKRLELLALALPDAVQIERPALLVALNREDHLPSLLRNRKAAATAPQSYWQQLLPVGTEQMARLISPIVSGDRARGYVSVIGPPDELDLLDVLTTEHGAAACALEMAKAKAISEARKELRGNFLEGLLAGRLPEREIERLAGRLDHDTGRPHAILTFRWDGDNPPSLRRLETPLNWLLSSHNRPTLTHIYSDDHVCIFQAMDEQDEGLGTAMELGRRLREHLRAEYPRARLVGGLSGPADTLADWPRVYREAVQAMTLSARLQLDYLVDFNQLGVYQLLTRLEEQPEVRRFCEQVIGPLARYDRQHRSSMIETLDAYFNHNGNISQTAESLYIHRNTLLYRLERIRELTGQDLDEADMRLTLHLALKLWQLQPGSASD
ncbi:MAG: helix-turn-helix domain-containing protein [Candidatus Promineifilaceae bacterium]|nr:helix-turn-helix domain-containing protein [Candidatus Promineifilaceae bacterium]